jgi:hypothetical protein
MSEEKQNELNVNKECLNGLEILKEHNLINFCPTNDADADANDIFSTYTGSADKKTTKYPSVELVSSWSSNSRVQFDIDGCVTSLDFGGKRLHNGLPCDPQVFGDQYFSRLKTLSLAGTDLPIKYIMAILPFIQAHIECLFLGGNAFGDIGAEQVSTWLPKAKSLVKLDLRYNEINAAGITAISRSLVDTNVQYLYLEGNIIGDEGCAAMVDFLLKKKENSQIREMFLGANHIQSSGAASLASLLYVNKNISKIYLEGNNIGINGAAAFCKVLEELNGDTGLRNLYVDNNNIGKELSNKLATLLKSETTIQDPLEV